MVKAKYVLALGASLLWAAPAHADERSSAEQGPPVQPASPKDEALLRFQRAIELHKEGDLIAALSEFRRAYELAPHPMLHFNIGQVCFDLRDYACATLSFRALLTETGDELSPERRAAVARDLEGLATRVAVLHIETNVSEADVFVDELLVGRTPLAAAIVLNPGPHRIRVEKASMRTATRAIDLAGADSVSVTVDLTAEAPVVAARPPPSPPAGVVSERRSRWTPLSWMGVAVSAGFATAGVVTGVLANEAASTVAETPFVGATAPQSLTASESEAMGLAIATDVLIGAATASLATTLIVTFAWPAEKGEPPSSLSVRAAPTALTLEARF